MIPDIDTVLALLAARAHWDNLPKCTDCWDRDEPGRKAFAVAEADEERCRWCGATTTAGIYVRAQDPAIVAAAEVVERLTAERDRLREALATAREAFDEATGDYPKELVADEPCFVAPSWDEWERASTGEERDR